jgi:hypothetical protein
MSGAVQYLFNYCAHNGCWVTAAERMHLRAGDYYGYYSEAGEGGNDGYALRARDIAMNEQGGSLVRLTNIRLENYLRDANPWMTQQELATKMDDIRVGLARAHAAALDSLGASPDNPRFLSPAQVANYHVQVFTANGAPPIAYGGFVWDKLKWLHGLYDYCTGSCRR